MKKIFIVQGIGFWLLAAFICLEACKDNTFTYPAQLQLEEKGANKEPTSDLQSSLKAPFKNNTLQPYQFYINVPDEADFGVVSIEYTLSGGTGDLYYEGNLLQGRIAPVRPGQKIELSFRPNTQDAVFRFIFLGENRFGIKLQKESKLTLAIVSNLGPVASFEIKKDESKGKYVYMLDASKSFDTDGGAIPKLVYTVSRDGILAPPINYDNVTEPLPVTLGGVGVYVIKLEVYDSEGIVSAPTVKRFEITN